MRFLTLFALTLTKFFTEIKTTEKTNEIFCYEHTNLCETIEIATKCGVRF
jgi:hypothetical protein